MPATITNASATPPANAQHQPLPGDNGTSLREEWKYTPLRKLEAVSNYTPSTAKTDLSALTSPAEGMTVTPLAWEEFASRFPQPQSNHPALNDISRSHATAWHIEISDNATPDTALSLAILSEIAESSATTGLILTMGKNSELTLIQDNEATAQTLTRALISIELQEGARLHYARTQKAAPDQQTTQLGLLHASLARNAALHLTTLITGAALSRQEDHIHLNEEGAEVTANSLTLLTGQQHGDITTRIHHHAEHTTSSQEARAVLTEKATNAFQGKIFVASEAQKTNGHQMSRALLLSPTATMNAKPELEIYADDVKCGHGTAIGALDESALFYMRARGIPQTTARRLLIEGFINEIITPLPEALYQPFQITTQNWLESLP